MATPLFIMNIELQHRGINFWIATFGKINILNNFSWTWRFPQTTNNIMSPLGLNFEFPMENDRRKFNPVLKIDLHYEWIYKFSVYKFPFGSPIGNNRRKLNQLHSIVHFSISWMTILILTIGKLNTFSSEMQKHLFKCGDQIGNSISK